MVDITKKLQLEWQFFKHTNIFHYTQNKSRITFLSLEMSELVARVIGKNTAWRNVEA